MLNYYDFYDIAKYANKNWKGGFDEKGVGYMAHIYTDDYENGINNDEPMTVIDELKNRLEEDLENMVLCNDHSNERKQVEFWLEKLNWNEQK